MCSIDSGLWCGDATTQVASDDAPSQRRGWRGVFSFFFEARVRQGRVTLPCKSLRGVRVPTRIITRLKRYIRTRRRNITRGSMAELAGSRDVDLCSQYVKTSSTRRSLSEWSGNRDVWNRCTRGSRSALSGSMDVDFSSRYVWTSRPGRSLSQLSGSRDVELCSRSRWTSRTRGTLPALSSSSDVGTNLTWRSLS